MGENTEKVICEKCGQAIKVPAGSELEDVHSHEDPKPRRSRQTKEE